MKYIANSETHVGKVRHANEDNLGDSQTINGGLFIVCDGMGGHVGGAQASHIAVKSIMEFFQRQVYDNIIQAIDHALIFANEQIYASAVANPELKGMGTTAVVLLIRDDECFIGHVGDSRIYLRSNGKLNRITKDHSFVQTLIDSGIINDEDAENHPNKNQILQALGISPVVKATICQEAILAKPGDLFLLCSDGLNGMVNDRDMEGIVQENNLNITSSNLITAALNAGGNDNITASLVLIEDSVHNNSRFVEFNPKPKVSDTKSTQQFSEASNSSGGSNWKMKTIILAALLLISAIIVLFLMQKDEDPKPERRYSKSELENLSCSEIDSILGKRIDFKDGEVINKVCADSYTFTIKDSVLKKVTKIILTDDKEPDDSIDAKVIVKTKSISEMTKNEIISLEINAPVSDANGEYVVHGYKVVIKNKVVDKKEKVNNLEFKVYVVADSATLSSIVDNHKAYSPKLNVQRLIDFNYNDNTSQLTQEEKTNLKATKIKAGLRLKIPCYPK